MTQVEEFVKKHFPSSAFILLNKEMYTLNEITEKSIIEYFEKVPSFFPDGLTLNALRGLPRLSLNTKIPKSPYLGTLLHSSKIFSEGCNFKFLQLPREISPFGLNVIDVPLNGNNLFYTISYALYGTMKFYHVLRLLLIWELIDNIQYYLQYMSGNRSSDRASEITRDFCTLLVSLLSPFAAPSNLSVSMQALCNAIQFPISLFYPTTKNQSNFAKTFVPSRKQENYIPKHPIVIGTDDNSPLFYYAIIPNEYRAWPLPPAQEDVNKYTIFRHDVLSLHVEELSYFLHVEQSLELNEDLFSDSLVSNIGFVNPTEEKREQHMLSDAYDSKIKIETIENPKRKHLEISLENPCKKKFKKESSSVESFLSSLRRMIGDKKQNHSETGITYTKNTALVEAQKIYQNLCAPGAEKIKLGIEFGCCLNYLFENVWVQEHESWKEFLKRNGFCSVDQARIYRNLSLLQDYHMFKSVNIGIKELSHHAKSILCFLDANTMERAYWTGKTQN